MGFRKPELPRRRRRLLSQGGWAEKIRPMARHWAEVGFGTPVLMHLFYAGRPRSASSRPCWCCCPPRVSTAASPQAVDRADRHPEGRAVHDAGLRGNRAGCGFGPALNHRYLPPMGPILYWLRPNTIRLPPWPGRVLLTAGDNRLIDIALYALLNSAQWPRSLTAPDRCPACRRTSECCRCRWYGRS